MKQTKKFFCFILTLCCLFVTGYFVYFLALQDSNSVRAADGEATLTWAVKIPNNALDNFYKVSNSLYRGAQPDAKGMRELQKSGVKTVINLREMHSDIDELKGTELKYFPIHSTAAWINMDEVEEFLKIMSVRSNYPVFVHCAHGSDRTGTMCAFYRMVFEGWSKEHAIKEMLEGGFGFHAIWKKSILSVIEGADIEALRKKYNSQQ